ncbi:MAG TPA: hypothetical protein VMV05_09630 [bacterium]|nr:hypothetical protein [bacterium]
MGKFIRVMGVFLLAGTAGTLWAESNGGGAGNPRLSVPEESRQAPGSSLTDGQDGDGINPTDTHEGGKPAARGGNAQSKLGNGASDDESIHLGSLGGNPKRSSHSLTHGQNNSRGDDESIHLGNVGGNPKRSSHSLNRGQNNSADDEGVHLGSLGGNPKRSAHSLNHGQSSRQGLSKFTGGVQTGKAGNGLAKNGLQKSNTLNSLSKNTIGGAGGAAHLPSAAK